MIVTLVCFIASHTPLTKGQVVRAFLLAQATWFTSLLLAIATTNGILLIDHVNRGAAFGAQSSDMEGEIVLPAANMEVVCLLRVESWTDRMFIPKVPNRKRFYVSNCNLPRI